MTDDELDLLASAYLDGEATPEEVALVERDPDLMARVEEFRMLGAGAESPVPPMGLAERHLAVAMAEFETLALAGPRPAATTDARSAPVVDLRDRRAARRARQVPGWLPAAAAFVVIGGGLVWAVGRTGGDDDTTSSFEAATADTATDAGSAERDAAAGNEASGAEEEMAALTADDAADESADESVMATEAAPAGDAEGSSDDADGGAEEATEPSPTTTAASSPPAPVATFDEVPDPDTLADLPEPIADLGQSRCGPEVVTPGLGEPLGFLPIEVAGQPAELFVFLQGDGTEVRLLVDESCVLIEP